MVLSTAGACSGDGEYETWAGVGINLVKKLLRIVDRQDRYGGETGESVTVVRFRLKPRRP